MNWLIPLRAAAPSSPWSTSPTARAPPALDLPQDVRGRPARDPRVLPQHAELAFVHDAVELRKALRVVEVPEQPDCPKMLRQPLRQTLRQRQARAHHRRPLPYELLGVVLGHRAEVLRP